jgi:two-component system cell cycle response regulator
MGEGKPLIRIMVVEDDPGIRLVLKRALESRWEVVTASDGQRALELLGRAEPDLLIIDVMMPGMDGFTLAKKIRESQAHRTTPFFFLTSLTSKHDAMQGYELGAAAYLHKPVDIDRLLKNIEITLEERGIVPTPKRFSIDSVQVEPRPPAQSSSPRRSKYPAKELPGRPRVLIVDDDDSVRHLLSAALQRDYEVFVAMNGREALDRIERLEPDLITVDLAMPRLNGFQLIESLRAHHTLGSTPILMITGQASESNVRRARDVGATAVIPKPVDIDQLRQSIAALVSAPDFKVRWPKSHSALTFPKSWKP